MFTLNKSTKLSSLVFVPAALLVLSAAAPSRHYMATGKEKSNDGRAAEKLFSRVSRSPARFRSVPTTLSDTGVTVTDIGPELGTVSGLEGFLINPQDPRQLLASTLRGGVFKSTDGGTSWFPSNNGLTEFGGEVVSAFNIRKDPGNPSGVYAIVTDSTNFYHSTDFSDTWAVTESDILADCAVHPTSPNVIFAVPLTLFSNGVPLWKSTDGGTTFVEQFGTGLPEGSNDSFTNIVFAPADPNIMYVASNGFSEGLYKSTDGGASFARLDGSPPFPLQIFPHPTQANTLFLQAGFGSTFLYQSTDGGATFDEVTAGLPAGRRNYFVAFDQVNPSLVYVAGDGGLFRSTDGGATFAALGLRPEQIGLNATTLSIDPTNTAVLYVNTSKGNFKSVNGGTSFFAINRGWRASIVNDLTFDNNAEPRLYVATTLDLGLLRTQSRGNYYDAIGENLFAGVASSSAASVHSVAVAATDPNFIVATTVNRGIFRSTDGGLSWTAATVDTGQRRFVNSEVAIDPTNSSNAYVTCNDRPFRGFYRSTDGGQTFFRVNTGLSSRVKALAIDPNNPNVIYVGAPRTLLKSTDGGLSFTATELATVFGPISDIAINPQNSQVVYVTGEFSSGFIRFVLRSTDGGATFTPADTGLHGTTHEIAIDPLNPSRLFVLSNFGFHSSLELFMSEDGAASWTLVDTGGEFFRRGGFDALAINPKKPNLLYLGGASVLEVEIKQ